jgi:hypothetical protein
MYSMSTTRLVSQPLMSLLNALHSRKVLFIVVTRLVFQAPMVWLKDA